MLRLATFSVLVLALAACENSAVNRYARDQQSAAWSAQRTLLREPACDGEIVIGPSCGLLLKRLDSEPFRARFAARHCDGVDGGTCRERYVAFVSAALDDRYPAADPDVVAKSCRMRGADCDDPVGYELVVMDAHNARVSDITARRELEIEAERRRLQAEHARQVYAATMTALFILHDGPKCSSHRGLGDTTLTFCKD